ncbi:MAG: VOC family protein [Myxococcota bacterium]|nr:VOC family protein [Myxococcota bacterium]
MLNKSAAVAMIAVKDLAAAKRFYAETLGLKEVDTMGEEVAVFESGQTKINVYRSEFAGTNKATALTWQVEDLDAEVKSLKDKGVKFEHYDMPDMERQGDIYSSGEFRTAWFKDPDGNILNLASD